MEHTVDIRKDGKKSRPLTCSLFNKEQIKIFIDDSDLSDCCIDTEENKCLPKPQILAVPSKMICLMCAVSFSSRKEQVEHYKLDWHRWNLDEKMKGNSPVSESKYNELQADCSELSWSDDENGSCFPSSFEIEDGELPSTPDIDGSILNKSLQPKIFFQTKSDKTVAIHRCVIYPKKICPSDSENLSRVLSKICEETTWAIILIGGGYFSAAVYEKNDVILHKTLHRYTVRAKQGKSQSASDGKQGGHKARSAGAILRRYNQATLAKEIRAVLSSWALKLVLCHRIFYRAFGPNKNILFGGKNAAFNRKDERLRTIPFPTGRASFSEAQRVHKVLSTLEYFVAEENNVKSPFAEVCKSPNKTLKCQQGRNVSSEPTAHLLELNVSSTIIQSSEILECKSNAEKQFTKCSSQANKLKGESNNDMLKQNEANSSTVSKYCSSELQYMKNVSETQDVFSSSVSRKDNEHSFTSASLNVKKKKRRKNSPTVPKGNDLQPKICSTSSNKDNLQSGVNGSVSNVEAKGKINPSICVSKDDDSSSKGSFREIDIILSKRSTRSLDPLREGSSEKEIENSSQIPNMANADSHSKADSAQLIDPVTESIANERLAEDVEKMKLKRKAKKIRMKGKKALALLQEAEEREKQKFLALSDREKINVASGLQKEITLQVFSRCFQCGVDMTGKTPFEYFTFKFCTVLCLKEHKTCHLKDAC